MRLRFTSFNLFVVISLLSAFVPTSMLEARSQIAVPASSLNQPTDNYLLETWKAGIWGAGIGASNINAVDLDEDGTIELVLGGGYGFGPNTFWYIVSHNPSNNTYSQKWLSKPYLNLSINHIEVAQTQASGQQLIFVVLTNGQVEIYNGSSRQLEYTLASGLSNPTSLTVADLDRDGQSEIIIGAGNAIAAFDVGNYAQKWRISHGAVDLAVANVDNDAALEIVTANKVIDGVTQTVEWEYEQRFGTRIAVADLNNDSIAEIVGAAGWYSIWVFSAVTRTVLWEIRPELDIQALTIADTNADGVQEIIYGDGQWGSIHGFNSVTRQREWSIANPEHGITDVAIANIDADDGLEVIWGAGWTSTGSDRLFVADRLTKKHEWRSQDVGGPLSAVDVGDVDNDGQDEIVMVSFDSESGYSDGIIFIYDAATHVLEWQSGPVLGGHAWTGVHSLKIADVDSDGKQDFLIATASLYDGVIIAYDGASRSVKWKTAATYGATFMALTIADLDQDGTMEVIGGQRREHTGAAGAFVRVYDGKTGVEEWRTVDIGYWSGITNIATGDLDGDGYHEIVFASQNGLQIYDAATRAQRWHNSAMSVSTIKIADVDGDNYPEMLLGTPTGSLYSYDGRSYEREWFFSIGSTALSGVTYTDLDNDKLPELLISDNQRLYIYDGVTRLRLWQSEVLGTSVGAGGHLVVKDINRDSRIDVVVGHDYALRQFSYSLLPFVAEFISEAALITPEASLAYRLNLSSYEDTTLPMTATITLPDALVLREDEIQASHGTVRVEGQRLTWTVDVEAETTPTLYIPTYVADNAIDGQVLSAQAVIIGKGFATERKSRTTVDALPPTTTITSPTAKELLTGEQYVIRGIARDSVSGVERVEVQIDDSPWMTATGTASWSLEWRLPDIDTDVTIRVRAIDKLGQVEVSEPKVTVSVDNIAPSLVSTFPSHGARYIPTRTRFMLTFSERVLLESLRFRCEEDLDDWEITMPDTGTIVYIDFAQPFAIDQLYSCVVLEAKDRAGHELVSGVAPNPWAFAVGNAVMPSAGNLVINGGAFSTTSRDISLRLDAFDPDGQANTLRMSFSNDGTTWSDWQAYAPVSAWELPDQSGVYSVYARVIDNDDNISAIVSDTITFEQGAIEGVGVSIDGGAIYTNQPTVTLTINGPASTAAMQISNDGGFNGSVWEPFTLTRTWQLAQHGNIALSRTVYVRFRDSDGVVSNIYQDDIVLDVTPPAGQVGVTPGDVRSNGVVLNFTISDDSSGVTAMRVGNQPDLSDAVWEPFSTEYVWHGSHNGMLYVQFRDKAANTSAMYTISLAEQYRVAIPMMMR
jgi:hypothetical protein